MQERIVEIIVYVLGELQQDRSHSEKVDISKDLSGKGYTDNEINLAFSWVFNHLRTGSHEPMVEEFDDLTGLQSPFEIEQLVIAPEAYGYLLQLINVGVLREPDIEMIVERALTSGLSSLSLEDIKGMVANIIFESGNRSAFGGYFNNQGNDILH